MRKMLKKLAKKIRSNSGETLVETLVAIIICVFASTMMAGSVTTASKLNKDAREADAKFRESLSIVENYETAADENKEDGVVEIVDQDESISPFQIQVIYIKSGDEADDLRSYIVAP